MIHAESNGRQAFSYRLRTGRQLTKAGAAPLELKFNPYHDPRNGQFTFAPGGPRSLDRVIVSRRGERARSARTSDLPVPREAGDTAAAQAADTMAPAMYRPGEDDAWLEPASSGNRTPQRGSTARRFGIR